jgi:hypothetical protein
MTTQFDLTEDQLAIQDMTLIQGCLQFKNWISMRIYGDLL